MFISAAALIVWLASSAFLILFAGILFGVLLDASVRGLSLILPIGRAWLLGLSCLVLFTTIAVLILVGGVYLVQEFDQVRTLISKQIEALREYAASLGLLDESNGAGVENSVFFKALVGDINAILGPATTALSIAAGAAFNVIIIAITGIFFAISPRLYRDGLLRLFPVDQRPRLSQTLANLGSALRWWLVGQFAAMVLIGVSVALALWLMGVPAPFLLGFQAGLLGFIPFVGPIIAGIPIMLTAMSMGINTAALVLVVYMVVQSIEGYLITPIIQKRAVHLPPIITIAAILVFGALFGEVSVALATPFIAIVRILVLQLYVEDVLERPRMIKDAPGHQTDATRALP